MNSEELSAESTYQPDKLTAFASWLRWCAVARCSEDEQRLLEDWAVPKFYRKADDPNVRDAFCPAPGKRAPVFQAFEIYCLTYPLDQSIKPPYKFRLGEMAVHQSPAKALSYAGTFFRTISRAVRKDFVAIEKNTAIFRPLANDESGHEEEKRFRDPSPPPDSIVDQENYVFLDTCADECWNALSDEHKLFLWADASGIPNSHSGLLKVAGLSSSTAHDRLKLAAEIWRDKLNSLLPEDSAPGSNFSSISAVVDRLLEKLNLWAVSENLKVDDFIAVDEKRNLENDY